MISLLTIALLVACVLSLLLLRWHFELLSNLNVLIHERGVYKDENARLRKAIVGTREGLKMMVDDSDTEGSRATAFSDAQLFLDEHCRQCGFPEGVEVES